ncbi:hypothetical protein DER46DRAFT_137583 [Fusarium sp. MPI-SDFR-AT-0072]|nr:hypothetical protein DER46DRAFT_137583 [Fusarium sp. MPI-SDFR-AT-0072]
MLTISDQSKNREYHQRTYRKVHSFLSNVHFILHLVQKVCNTIAFAIVWLIWNRRVGFWRLWTMRNASNRVHDDFRVFSFLLMIFFRPFRDSLIERMMVLYRQTLRGRRVGYIKAKSQLTARGARYVTSGFCEPSKSLEELGQRQKTCGLHSIHSNSIIAAWVNKGLHLGMTSTVVSGHAILQGPTSVMSDILKRAVKFQDHGYHLNNIL